MEFLDIATNDLEAEDRHRIDLARAASTDTCLTQISRDDDQEENDVDNKKSDESSAENSSNSSPDISYQPDDPSTTISVHDSTPVEKEFVDQTISSEHEAVVVAAPPQPSVLSPRHTFFMLILLCSTNVFQAMSASLVAPYFPREVLLKGGSVAMVGLVMSSYDAVRFILAPLFGLWINRIGIRFLLISGSFMVAYCTVLFGLLGRAPPNTWFFILAAATRSMAGLGAIMYGVTTISIQPIIFSNNFGVAFVRQLQLAVK